MTNRIGKKKFDALPVAEQARIAKLDSNRQNMQGTLAQCMPHSRLSDLTKEQWAQLGQASFELAPRSFLNVR